MKALTILVALLFGHLFINAQQISFIKYWGDHGSDAGYDARQLKDSGYIVVGDFADSTNYPNAGLLLRTDKYGNLLKLKIVCGIVNSVYKTTDSSIFVFGGYFNACGSNTPYLYEVNYNLDTIWHKDFNYGFSSYCDVGIKEHYTIGGGYVSKLDSNWNLEVYWDYTNINPNLDIIRATPDGGFVAAGLNYWQPDSLETYTVLKCDSNGIQQWYRTYGTNPPDFINLTQYPPTSILVLPDSNYIITTKGNWDLFKVNKDSGDTVFTRKYSTLYNGIYRIEPINNNRYVANAAWALTLLDSNFSLISYGSYATIGGWYQSNDGGFYGAAYADNILFPSLNHNAVALYKTDSLGFIYNYQGIEQLQQVGGLTVYPNPATNVLVVASPPAPLPGRGEQTVTVYDVMGKVKLQQKLTATDGKLKMDVSSLVSGIYFLKINNSVQKFVKAP